MNGLLLVIQTISDFLWGTPMTIALIGTGLYLSINPDGVTNKCNWNSESGDIKGTDIKSALSAIASNPGFVSMPNGDIAAAMKFCLQ